MIKRLIKRAVVTGVGDQPGMAVVSALKRRGWLVVGADSVFCSIHVHQFYIISRPEQPGFVDELLLLVGRERTTLVIPTRFDECRFLAAKSPEFLRIGAGLYLPPPAAIEDLKSPGSLADTLKRLGIERAVPVDSAAGDSGSSLFEATLCRADGSFTGSAVFALDRSSGDIVHAERRKGEEEVETLAQAAAEALDLRGPATIHLRREADGRLGIAGVALSPCVYAPLADDVLDGLLMLWERDQPA